VRRVLDVVLVVAILAAAGFGAYKLGSLVDSKSKQEASRDSELSQPTAARHTSSGPSRHTVELVLVGIGGAAGAMILVSFGRGFARRRRRQRWHAA
jgi:hypothetical protein